MSEGTKCPHCGAVGWTATSGCKMCGHSVRPALSLLTVDGQVIVMGQLSARLNQSWAKQELGEDAIYWDRDWQFSVEPRDQDWVLIPNPEATNDTLLDGRTVTTEAALAAGMVVSVGSQAKAIQKTQLTVRFG